jgi:hypothetical protein
LVCKWRPSSFLIANSKLEEKDFLNNNSGKNLPAGGASKKGIAIQKRGRATETFKEEDKGGI